MQPGTEYDPVTRAADNGSNLMNELEKHRTVGIDGNQNIGHGTLEIRNRTQIMQSTDRIGGAYIGVMNPQTAMEQTHHNHTCTTPRFSPIAGGHCDPVVEYTATHLWEITWGKFQAMTWDIFFRYCDEAYAIVDPTLDRRRRRRARQRPQCRPPWPRPHRDLIGRARYRRRRASLLMLPRKGAGKKPRPHAQPGARMRLGHQGISFDRFNCR